MNWYLVLKFFHVAAAIAWLGGAGATVFAAAIVPTFEMRKNIIEVVGFLSNRLFVPSLVLVLVTGLLMWWVGALTFDAWVAWGLAGALLTGGIGATILGPTAERISKLLEANASEAEMAPQMMRLLRAAQADMVGLTTIVFAMVVKPSWSDRGLLIAMIVVLVAGASYFLTRPISKAAAA